MGTHSVEGCDCFVTISHALQCLPKRLCLFCLFKFQLKPIHLVVKDEDFAFILLAITCTKTKVQIYLDLSGSRKFFQASSIPLLQLEFSTVLEQAAFLCTAKLCNIVHTQHHTLAPGQSYHKSGLKINLK